MTLLPHRAGEGTHHGRHRHRGHAVDGGEDGEADFHDGGEGAVAVVDGATAAVGVGEGHEAIMGDEGVDGGAVAVVVHGFDEGDDELGLGRDEDHLGEHPVALEATRQLAAEGLHDVAQLGDGEFGVPIGRGGRV